MFIIIIIIVFIYYFDVTGRIQLAWRTSVCGKTALTHFLLIKPVIRITGEQIFVFFRGKTVFYLT